MKIGMYQNVIEIIADTNKKIMSAINKKKKKKMTSIK